MTKKVALYDKHLQLGAKMISFAGYDMPVRYTSDKAEHICVREKAGVFDVSHMGQFFFSGPEAADLVQWVTSNDVTRIKEGEAQYSCLTNKEGGIVDDVLVYCLKADEYMLIVNAANIEKDYNWIINQKSFTCQIDNRSDEYSLLALQGPEALNVLNKVSSSPVDSIGYYKFRFDTVAGVKDVFVSATGYTGEKGYELMMKNEDALTIWNALFEAGEEFGIQPIGLGARDTLRLEKGYCLYGNDITDNTTPLEAGLGWITKLDKDFIGKEIIQEQKANGISQKLTAFKMMERGIPRNAYRIYSENNQEVGKVTSGTMSPSLNVGIGLGYIKKENSAVDTDIFIEIRNKLIPAKVVKLPFL